MFISGLPSRQKTNRQLISTLSSRNFMGRLGVLLFMSTALLFGIIEVDHAVATAAPSLTQTAPRDSSSSSNSSKPNPKLKPKLAITGLHVMGNQILNGDGQAIRLLGVNRPGTEYACIENFAIFSGPSDAASVAAIANWHATAVRVPLNEDCWLAINNSPASYSGSIYRQAIVDYVNLLNSYGLVAILDLHWSAPGTTQAMDQQAMADEDHAPAFWTSVATTFKGNSSVIFDLYNEPYPDNNTDSDAAWTCLRDGGICSGVTFTAAGMQELVNTVRATGATNIVMIGGVNFANSLTKWWQYKPSDPTGNLVASWHSYDTETCNNATCWNNSIGAVMAKVPVVTGEIGEDNCKHVYIDSLMNWLDSQQSNYLAWAWIVVPCGLSLITDYNGTPSQTFGQGFHDHLAALATLPATTLSLTAQTNPAAVGQSVSFTANVSPVTPDPNHTPSGTVTFVNTTTGQTIGSAVLANGTAIVNASFDTSGNYVIAATYAGDPNFSGSTNSLTQQVTATSPTVTPPVTAGYTYNLPLLANAANTAIGNTTTYITFQNLSVSTSAHLNVQYYSVNDGTNLNLHDTLQLPPKGQKAILPAIGMNTSAGGIISSDQPLNVVVSESLNAGGSAYNVTAASASTLYSPLALNGQYGFTTSIVVFNGTNTTNATGKILFYDEQGNAITPATQTFELLPHSSKIFKQNDNGSGLNSNHAYWAKIVADSSSTSLSAQVIEFGANNFVATFNALVPTQLKNTLYAPATFNGQFNFVTGMALANPNPAPASLTITYYDANGGLLLTQPASIAAAGVIGVFQPAVSNLPATVSSATITSDQPLIMTVNERGPGTISGTYVGLTGGSQSIALPVIANGFGGFTTGATILNTNSGSTANVSFTYLDGSGNSVGSSHNKTLAPNASFLIYQGDSTSQALPNGFFGTALISSDQPLLVTTNALNNTSGLFYTYTEPN